MIKKKIIIVNNNLHIGGVQKALVSLLWEIKDRYDITLLLFHNEGEYLKELPEGIKIVSAKSAYKYLGMAKDDIHSLKDKIWRSFFAAISRVFGRKYAIRLMAIGQETLRGYDVAISYLHNSSDKAFYGGCNDFVLKHVQADKKITFLHCDYKECGADTIENAAQYTKFDVITACSQGCADSFLSAVPNLKEKVKVVKNCHRFDDIEKKADEAFVDLPEDKINIVTVARLGKEKGVERGVQAVAQLEALKDKLHYYIVGDGIQRPLIQQIIKEQQLENIVTLCGMMDNPYGYIKAADLLLIPSYSEAAPLVIAEAAGLGTPILSTETSSAKEMIRQTGLGWVCDNSIEGITDMLKRLVSDYDNLKIRKACCKSQKLNNDCAVSKFCECIE